MQEIHESLVLSAANGMGIFFVKFSHDGRELFAGSSNNSIYTYDLQADKVTSHIFVAHVV